VRLLSQLTRQVAIVQYPSLSRSTVRHIELVAMTPTRVMVILILSTGRVEQRLVELEAPISEVDLADLRVKVNQAADGVQIAVAAAALLAMPDSVRPDHAGFTREVVTVLTDAMSDHRSDERVAVSGTANLARYGDFDTAVRPLLEAIEEHVVLLKLLGESGVDAVTVRIGHEGPYSELSATSVVATGYGPLENHLGSLGVVGPTRMDYPGSMAAVRAVARYVSRILDEGHQ
jgi:heat-inducible transcriptional repressor